MVQTYLDGDVKTARELQLKYIELIQALFSEVNPIPVKKALELMEFQTKVLRLPLTELDEKKTMHLMKIMEDVNLL